MKKNLKWWCLSPAIRKTLLAMKLSLLLMLVCTLQLSASVSLGQQVSVQSGESSLGSILEDLNHQTGTIFMYNKEDVDDDVNVELNMNSASLEEVLDEICEQTSFKYEIIDEFVVITKKAPVVEQPIQQEKNEIKGKVTDEEGEPLAGATIWEKGTRQGTVSNFDGDYTIKASKGSILVFSFIGLQTKEITVEDQYVINVTMEKGITSLGEVQVISTGYQKVAKERATGSFSVLKSEDLEKVPVSNIINKLEGRVAGLQVDILSSDNTFVYDNLFGDSEAKTSYNFKIRGQSTYRANNMPLIVVDGVSTELDIKSLNPKDIESITFLKDAASASIYGARAANGVIVVETKKGGRGKASVNYSQTHTFSSRPSLSDLPLMNSEQVLNLEQELINKGIVTDPAAASGLYNSTPISQGMEIMFQEQRGNITQAEKEAGLGILRERNNYGQIEKYLLQAAMASTYDFSISGGKDDYTYFTSASYSTEETQSKGDEGNRLTLTANQNFKLFNYAKVTTSLRGAFFNYEKNSLGLAPLTSSLTSFLPYNQVVDKNGNPVNYYRSFYSADVQELETAGYLPWTYSYIDELNNADNSVNEQNYSANISVTLPIVKGLDVKGTYFIERSYVNNENFYNESTYYTRDAINYATYLDPTTASLSAAIPEGGILQNNKYIKSSYTARGQLNYNNVIKEKHTVDAIAGIELRQTKNVQENRKLFGYNEDTQTSVDLPSTAYTTVYGYSGTLSYGNGYSSQRRRFLSYYSNVAYTYNNKYTVSGSIRLDDYNNFGVDKKYRRTPLWSSGAKWNIGKENFMKEVSFVDNLNFRVSYGFNGNISLTTYPFTNISLVSSDSFSYDPYAFVSAAANPSLRWEKTGILNFGLDFSLFRSRLNGSIEYYTKDSKDLIQDFSVSEFYGLPNNSLIRNTATLKGKGVDLNLHGKIIDHKDFGIDAMFIMSYNTNEVTDSRYTSYSSYLNGTGSTPPIKGYSLNSVFAFRNAGLDETGSTLIYDKDENIVDANATINDIEDMKYMGSSTPKYYGSFNTTFRYKKLSLYLLATYKLGYVQFKPSFENYISRYGTFSQYDLHTDIVKRWQNPGDEANTIVPGVQGMYGYSYNRYRYSDKNVINGDHIRLREISLSYDFSGFLENTFIRSASLSFTARNLGIIWRANDENIDPDFPSYLGATIKLPPTAMYSIGVNVNF